MTAAHTCPGCGHRSKRPVLACAKCRSVLPRSLLPDLDLAGSADPSTPYWRQVAAAVTKAMAGHRQAKDERHHPRRSWSETTRNRQRARA